MRTLLVIAVVLCIALSVDAWNLPGNKNRRVGPQSAVRDAHNQKLHREAIVRQDQLRRAIHTRASLKEGQHNEMSSKSAASLRAAAASNALRQTSESLKNNVVAPALRNNKNNNNNNNNHHLRSRQPHVYYVAIENNGIENASDLASELTKRFRNAKVNMVPASADKLIMTAAADEDIHAHLAILHSFPEVKNVEERPPFGAEKRGKPTFHHG